MNAVADAEGQARMAAARLVAYGWGALNEADHQALVDFPEHMPDGFSRQLDVAAGVSPPTAAPKYDHDHETEVAMYGECITCVHGRTAGRARAADGIGRAGEHADDDWKAAARAAVLSMDAGAEFTTDDVWRRIPAGLTTPEPRAMGAVMTALAGAGAIRKTDRVRESVRPEAHANPKAVWIRATT